MALFRRRREANNVTADNDTGSDPPKQKGNWKRPANTAFKQQRLKAWQPILTPKTVLPTLFIIGILFAPIGALLVWGSSRVTEMTFDYTDCDEQTAQAPSSSLNFAPMPHFSYRLRSSDAHIAFNPPQFAFVQDPNADIAIRNSCIIRFDVPADLDHTVLLYYKLTNFYQNHRRYVKSLDTGQLHGKAPTASDLDGGSCKPLGSRDGKPIWPCGLIANSIFNDTLSNLTQVGGSGSYAFSENGIAWPGEAKKYAEKPGYANLTDFVPPPNWLLRFPNGYNDTNLPNLHTDEHFQNWMRTAGLPTFTKLYGRNDNDKLLKGTYEITVHTNFPVKPYKGTKSVVISTVSWMGGKNPFLGWAYIAASGLFIIIAIAGTVRHVLRPRRLGDMSLLSWNR
ncbi:Lem3/Cdc50 [Rickenella mellea]|uniref:Lem3/Cdc50 n=1 Tax=Rickenella mellea TaxID=50990 RepID=A0A4Y7QHS8_9AGAM|nr:Lem3/Cdc50 [Rickenella mellea]